MLLPVSKKMCELIRICLNNLFIIDMVCVVSGHIFNTEV